MVTNSSKHVSKPTLFEWARNKMEDDFDLTIRGEAEIAEVRQYLGDLRQHVSMEPQLNFPEIVSIFVREGMPDANDLDALRAKTNSRDGLTVWIECTQVGSLATLGRFVNHINQPLKIRCDFATGHDLVHALNGVPPAERPDFAVITCAPYCLFNEKLPYEWLAPIHFENQYILRQIRGLETDGPKLYVLTNSTAEALYLSSPSQRAGGRRIPCRTPKELIARSKAMRAGDRAILWKPPSLGLPHLVQGVQADEKPVSRSPIALFCREKTSNELKAQFARLFFQLWDLNAANRKDAFGYMKVLLNDAGQLGNRVGCFASAAGVEREDIGMPTESQRGGKEQKVIAILLQHPGWTNKQIADAAGCNVKSLPRMKTFKLLRKANRNALPGSKKARDGVVESSFDHPHLNAVDE